MPVTKYAKLDILGDGHCLFIKVKNVSQIW